MEPIVNTIQAVGTYIYQVGEAAVVGTSDTVVAFGQGTVEVLKAVFQGIGIG